MRSIELSDETINALQSQADARGISLQAWVESLAREPRGSAIEEMRKLRTQIKPDPEGWTTRDYIEFGRR